MIIYNSLTSVSTILKRRKTVNYKSNYLYGDTKAFVIYPTNGK